MKRFVLAATAVLAMAAVPATAAPVRVVGTGFLNSYNVSTPDGTTRTPVSSTFQFSLVYDTTGSTVSYGPYVDEPGILSYSSAFTGTVLRYIQPTISGGATSYSISVPGAGTYFFVNLATASPVTPDQGAVSFLSSSVSFGSANVGGGQGYSGYLTALSTASAVPEAATWAMMIVGAAMIGAAARRRRSTAVRSAALA